jgi:pimeloyl-ACP methyl ester carboxylesterase
VEGPANGLPLLLIHGVTARWQTFLPILPALIQRYHVYAPDLRGHGKSFWATDGYEISNDRSDVVNFIREVVKEPVVLLGWSLGAMIAILVAVQEPGLVLALIMADPPLAVFTEDDSSVSGFYDYFSSLHQVVTQEGLPEDKRAAFDTLHGDLDELQLRSRFAEVIRCDPEELRCFNEKKKFEDYHLENLFPRIGCPVLLIRGNDALGGALNEPIAINARALLKDCVYVYLSDIGHDVHDAQPARFVQLVSNFIESI